MVISKVMPSDILMSKGRSNKAFGKKKADPLFIDGFLNDSFTYTDFRLSPDEIILEQSTHVKYDIQNNRISFGRIDSEGDLMNAMHAVSAYYDIMMARLDDGFVEDFIIHDKAGNIQQITKPDIMINQAFDRESCGRSVYLDHPERIHGSYGKPNSWDGKDDSPEAKNKRSLERRFKNIDVKDFKGFNQGTDFIIINRNISSVEELLDDYNDALQKKAGYVIAELFGKYRRHIGEGSTIYGTRFFDDEDGAILKAPLEECVKLAERGFDLNKHYYLDFRFPIFDSLTEINPESLKAFVKEKFMKTQSEFAEKNGFIPYLPQEKIKDYANRLYQLSNRDDETAKALLKFLRMSFGYGSDGNNQIENQMAIDTAVRFYSAIRDLSPFSKIVENISRQQKEDLETMFSGKKFSEIVNIGLEQTPLDMLAIIQDNHDMFKDILSAECQDSFKKALKGYFFDKDEYVYDILGGIRPFGYWMREYPFIKEDFSDVYERAIRTDAFDTLRNLGQTEEDVYTRKVYVVKSWLKEVKRQKIQLLKENNHAIKEKIDFTSKELTKFSKGRSFFVVPTFILYFKEKQYERFTQQLDEYGIPYQTGESSTFLYDMRRSEFKRERIPDKLRNEFRINPFSTDKQAIGVRKYNSSRGAKREQRVSYFADINLLIKRSNE